LRTNTEPRGGRESCCERVDEIDDGVRVKYGSGGGGGVVVGGDD